jgi:uncharacterized protein YecE (DUF72 family)
VGSIRIGTSGWSYPSGAGTWNGVFYPTRAGRARGGRFDDLSYYAERFDTVEVNSTFYRTPEVSVTRSWARRTPPGFEFSVKLYQKFTHPEMFRKATGLDERASRADVDACRRAYDPIAESGRMGALLVQFPPSFTSAPASLDYLAWLVEMFAGYRVAVELRHRSWSDGVGGTLRVLNGLGAAWVQIDEPKFRFSIRQNYLPNVTSFSYMRFHGRNAAKWWRHETADERYNYLYSSSELGPFVEVASASRELVRKVYLYFNNHFAAKAVANANQVRHELGLDLPGDYPQEFVDRYPDMRGLVRVASVLPLDARLMDVDS